MGRLIQLSVENKSICTYAVDLWGTAANSNLEILQRYQNKILRMIVDAPHCYQIQLFNMIDQF